MPHRQLKAPGFASSPRANGFRAPRPGAARLGALRHGAARLGAPRHGAPRHGAALLLAATLLATLPGVSHAGLEFRSLRDPSEYLLQPLSSDPNGLPSTWRFSSPGPGQDGYGDPTVSVSVDPITGLVRESYSEDGVEIRTPLVASEPEYNSLMTHRNTRRMWRDRFRQNRSIDRAGVAPRGGMFRLALPVVLPKAVRSIIGDGAPNLEVTGSETITLAGTSDWTVHQTSFSGERKRQGAFPSFEMKQELNVNLTGSIGDKIKVDVDQSSNVQTSLDNKVKLRYEGDDDDMIKSIELGNTNLSLQGASIRQEGLFGVKTAARLGNVEVVTIASKQEGKNETARFTPSGDKTQVIIRDVDYIKRQYFSLTDHFASINYNGTQRLEVYKKNLSTNQGSTFPDGVARLDPTKPFDARTNPEVTGSWVQLTLGTDFTIEEDHWQGLPNNLKVPVIRLTQPISEVDVLGVAYTDKTTGVDVPVGFGSDFKESVVDTTLHKYAGKLLLKAIKVNTSNDLHTDPATNDYLTDDPWYPTVQLELKNFYDLGARNISTATMVLKIYQRKEGEAVNPDYIGSGKTPLIQALALDEKDITGEAGHDGKVDLNLVDAERGVLFFPDLTPFSPSIGDTVRCGDGGIFPITCLNLARWSAAVPGSGVVPRVDYFGSEDNPVIYTRRTFNSQEDNRFYIQGEFQSSRSGYYLGRFNILEGSEVVKVDGIPYRRDSDYTIDYDTGQLTFLKVPGADQVISVDYSYAPGAGQVQRTLLGFSTSYNPANNLSFSSSLLYESKGAQEELVKLGEEPATTLIGDLSSVLSFRPTWMTQLTNLIPGIRTSASSALNIQGSVSTSVPDPNTKGEAYVDDMEGNKESNTIPLSRVQWLWSSVPDSLGGVAPAPSLLEHARLRWYNPVGDDNPWAAKEHDLKPVLKKEEGGENQHQVLALDVVPPAGDSTLIAPTNWTGITVPLGTVGQDLSRVQYFEIWVNDFRKDHTLTRGRIHFDFGRVSEDAFWDPRNPPNNVLDTEDKNGDGKLDRPTENDKPTADYEDTGLDGIVDQNEPGYDGSTNPDPNGDDYGYDASKNRDDYTKINNLEGNALDDPNARPDTEDLNRDGALDTNNDYFERSLDLADTSYVAIDIPNEYASFPVVTDRPKVPNGWRLYRIPVDTLWQAVGRPSWTNVQAVRIWVDGMTDPLRLQIGGIEMIGSRWLRQSVPDPNFYAERDFEVRARNNKDDAGIYVPPYDVKHQVGITADRREQSLALRYGRTEPGDTLLAFKTYGDIGNTMGWTLYQEIRFWVHGDAGSEAQQARAIARFGPDTVNYYEYSIPLRSGWQPVVIPMERLSGLKERPRTPADSVMIIDRETGAATGEIYSVRGNPTFTRVNRVTFGVAFDSTAAANAAGEVWFDDLRLSAVRKDRGFASSVTVQANFADVLALNGTFTQQDKDFFRVGLGANQGSGFDHTATGLSSTLNLDRFLPTSGVQLPVRFSAQHSQDIPKFRTGSDVILDESRQDIERRESNSQSIDLSYSRTSPKKGLARYTIDAINGRMSYSRDGSVNPQSSDSSWQFITNASYSIPIGGNGVRLGPLRVNPIPRTLTLSADWVSTRRVSYSRDFPDSGAVDIVQDLRSDVKQRLLGLRMDTSLEPLSGIRMTYRLNSQRDMLLHQNDFFGFNRGTEIRHEQNVGLNYRPRWLTILQPQIDLNGNYSEDAGPTVRLAATDPRNLKRIQNSGTVHANVTIPLSRFGGRQGAPNDTSDSFSPLAPFRFVFSKMQDISAGFDLNRSAALDRVGGDPGLAFKTGFTEVFDDQITRFSNSNFQTARRYSVRANTSFRPVERLSFDIHGDYQLQFTDQVGGALRTAQTAWPDVNARWTDLQRLLGLNQTLTSMTVNSWFTRKTQESGRPDRDPDQVSETNSFNPLLGWDLMFRSGVHLTAASGFDLVRTNDNRAADFIRDRKTKSTRLAVNKTYPASKGIKFPWSKKRLRLPNDLNLGIQADLGADLSVVHHPPFQDIVEEDRTRLNVGSSTNYNFSQSISGGWNLAFRQTTDRKLNVTQRGITMSFTGTFRF